jgi:uncharacterized protein with PQ loop repeat
MAAEIIAGSLSAVMFSLGNIPMLWKAFTTKKLTSYSLTHILLNNVANLIYWIYVYSLPVGPIWFLHGTYTVSAAILLLWYCKWELKNRTIN